MRIKIRSHDLRGSSEDLAEGGKDVMGCEEMRDLDVGAWNEFIDFVSSVSSRGVTG